MPPGTTPPPSSNVRPTPGRTTGRKPESPSRIQSAQSHRRGKQPRGLLALKLLLMLATVSLLLAALFLAWFFLTPSGTSFRYRMADTLITTQHRHWAAYLVGEEGLKERVAEYAKQFEEMGEERDTHEIVAPSDKEPDEDVTQPVPLTEIEPISGDGYKGYLLTVSDPTKVRLVVTSTKGKGEKVTSMVKRTGAIAGVNAGGFADPNWQGNGFQPIGMVISQGKVFYRDIGMDQNAQIVGIDKEGKMIAGRYTINELLELGISEAVSFSPRIIVNGKGLIKNHSQGWGIAPRTVMGQKEDGSILFLTIDGRQPGYSIGADLYDAQEIMLEHGAVIAANLDGGSSTVLVTEGGEIANKPSSTHGERYLPTAWLVFDNPSSVTVNNIWAGLTAKDIDPSKW